MTPCPLGRGVGRGNQSWDSELSPSDLRPKDNVGNGLLEATVDASDLSRNINKNELQDGRCIKKVTKNLIKCLL